MSCQGVCVCSGHGNAQTQVRLCKTELLGHRGREQVPPPPPHTHTRIPPPLTQQLPLPSIVLHLCIAMTNGVMAMHKCKTINGRGSCWANGEVHQTSSRHPLQTYLLSVFLCAVPFAFEDAAQLPLNPRHNWQAPMQSCRAVCRTSLQGCGKRQLLEFY